MNDAGTVSKVVAKRCGATDIGHVIMPPGTRDIPIGDVLQMPPVPGSIKWLAVATTMAGIKVHLVSRQIGGRKDIIGAWMAYRQVLKLTRIAPENMHIVEELDWAAKASAVMQLNPEFMIDDKLEVLRAIVEYCTKHGLKIPRLYLFKPDEDDRKKFKQNPLPRVTLINGWKRIAKLEGWWRLWQRANRLARKAKKKS